MASSAASAAVKTSSVVSKYFLGKCMPSLKESSAKIRIPRLVLDEYLHMVRTIYTYHVHFQSCLPVNFRLCSLYLNLFIVIHNNCILFTVF